MIKKYRKKPVVIEAVQRNGNNLCEIISFVNSELLLISANFESILIKTLEGNMRVDLGDWVIKGIQGEFYPCKPSVFEKTYEEV